MKSIKMKIAFSGGTEWLDGCVGLPISGCAQRRDKHRTRPINCAGFTLIELLIVLTIVATVAAIILPRLTLPYRLPTPELVSFLEGARAESLKRVTPVRVFEGADRVVYTSAEQRFELAKDTFLANALGTEFQLLPQRHLVTFFPDGTATVARFDIVDSRAAPQRGFEIRVDPFNGRVSFRYL